jgi:cbb3-type cytochrome oxidase subunit 3
VIVAPLWVFLILFAIAGVVALIFGPKWKKEAEERKRLFEKRQEKDRIEDQ